MFLREGYPIRKTYVFVNITSNISTGILLQRTEFIKYYATKV